MLSIQDEMLQKAAHNLERVQSYFESRTTWTVPQDSKGAVSALHLISMTMIQVALEPLLETNGLDLEPALTHRRVDQLPAAELDQDRLAKFSGFVEQLSDWFVAQSGNHASPTGKALLERIYRSVERTTLSLEALLKHNRLEFTPLRPPPPPAEPEVTELEQGNVDARLILEDSETEPVLQTFRGNVELSYEANQAIDGLLEEAGLKYSPYQHDKFMRKVLQWVQATPQGHVLEIKISTLHGRREPYPTYNRK
jgi:hypothetical protein